MSNALVAAASRVWRGRASGRGHDTRRTPRTAPALNRAIHNVVRELVRLDINLARELLDLAMDGGLKGNRFMKSLMLYVACKDNENCKDWKMTSEPYAARLNMVEENDDLVLYCEIRETRRDPFKRIARRYSGEEWVSLEPGYVVRGSTPGTDYKSIEIEYDPIHAEMQ